MRAVLLSVVCCLVLAQATTTTHDFAAVYNFDVPYDTQKQGEVGYWITGGASEVHSKGIALTTGPNQRGMLWNPVPVNIGSWQITFKFSVHGTYTEGDHGFVMWYTETAGVDGTVFGNQDLFKGLGIIFDSKDDDGNKNNPSVAAHLYDGTIRFHHDDDGIGDQLAGCVADFRNRPEPITARVTYKRSTKNLEVYIDMVNKGRFQRCLSVDEVEMPKNFFFGFTAETLEKDDVHMVHGFKVIDLSSGQGDDVSGPPDKPHELKPHHSTHMPISTEDSHKGSPAHKLRQAIQDHAASATAPPQVPIPPQVDHHAANPTEATVRHTKFLVEHVDKLSREHHQKALDHVTAHISSIHEKLDESTEQVVNRVLKELRANVLEVQSHTTTELEAKITQLLGELRKEVDSSLQVYAQHTNEALEAQSRKIGELKSEIELVKSSLRTEFSKVEGSLTHLNAEVGKASGNRPINQHANEIRQVKKSIETMQQSIEDSIHSKSGIGWLGMALMGVVVLGVLYLIWQSWSSRNLGPLASSGQYHKGV